MSENNLNETQKFNNLDRQVNKEANQILKSVYDALIDKGYNPVNQIVGYILSGDPTYITASNNARSLICRLERDELLEEVIRFYLANNNSK